MSSPRDFSPVSVRCIKILIQVGVWLCLLTVRGRICLLELFAGLGYTENDFNFVKINEYKKALHLRGQNINPRKWSPKLSKMIHKN